MEYSKSIIQSSSSSSSSAWKYDVFVSFRGEDIRNSFADHLFAAFQRKAIVAFRDDTNLKQREHMSTKIMQAIEGSQVLIVVFSKNYATSSWCLQELGNIVDCMKVKTGPIVLPIFYDVSPSEVRNQSGNYGKAFAQHEERFKKDVGMVHRWREALEQVANLSGWDIQNKPQYTEIEKIVERVMSILGYKLSSLDGVVGMNPHVKQFEKLLDLDSNDDVQVVGISGTSEIGKTTLAVYDRNFHRYGPYGDTYFIDDGCGPIGSQKQIICLNEEIQDIWNLSPGMYLIKTRLRRGTQSSNEDGESPQNKLSEGEPKGVQTRTGVAASCSFQVNRNLLETPSNNQVTLAAPSRVNDDFWKQLYERPESPKCSISLNDVFWERFLTERPVFSDRGVKRVSSAFSLYKPAG